MQNPEPISLCKEKRFIDNWNVDEKYRKLTCFEIWHQFAELPKLDCNVKKGEDDDEDMDDDDKEEES